MPFNRPTLEQIIDRISTDLKSRLEGIDPLLRRSVARSIAFVQSGATHGLHGHLAWIANQIMPDTAEAEQLERWASIWGLSRIPAKQATGNITLTGTDGSLVPAGAALQRGDGFEYTTDADATISSGSATVTITATDAGADGNSDAGTLLSLISPISGVDTNATVATGGLTNGVDEETDAALLERLLQRIQQPPQGGAAHDYIAWARGIAGVTRAWCYPEELGPGTVTVRIVSDDDPGGPIPNAALIQDVQDYIDSVRPVTADVTVVAPIAVSLDMTIAITPDTSAVRAAVEAELNDLLLREAQPEGGNEEGTILISHLREAISIAAGETDHTLISPSADITHSLGQMAVMGTITWS